MLLERLELQWALILGTTLYDTVAGVYFGVRYCIDAARSRSAVHQLGARCYLGMFASVLGNAKQGDALLEGLHESLRRTHGSS